MAKILVADDNSNIQKMVGLALKDQGIDVVAVGNGEAAVRKISDIKPDLVLADVFMPVRNGYEVCRYVKEDSALSHIPVILLVGAFDPLDEQEAQRAGADGVLKKPFVPPDPLISMVKSALTRAGVSLGPTPGAAADKAPAPATPKRSTQEILSGAMSSKLSSFAPEKLPEAEPEPAEEFPTAPPQLKIAAGSEPLAFGSLLETSEAEDLAMTSKPMIDLSPRGKWDHESDEEAEEEKEQTEESPSAGWRPGGLDEAIEHAAHSKPATPDWREEAFHGNSPAKSFSPTWGPSAEPGEMVEAAESRSVAVATVEAKPAESSVPFTSDAWAAAMAAGVEEKLADMKQAETAAPESVAAPEVHERKSEAAAEVSPAMQETVASTPEPEAVKSSAEEPSKAISEASAPSEPAAVAESSRATQAVQATATEPANWASVPETAWEIEAKKAALLASTWDAPKAFSVDDTQDIPAYSAEAHVEHTEPIIEAAAEPSAYSAEPVLSEKPTNQAEPEASVVAHQTPAIEPEAAVKEEVVASTQESVSSEAAPELKSWEIAWETPAPAPVAPAEATAEETHAEPEQAKEPALIAAPETLRPEPVAVAPAEEPNAAAPLAAEPDMDELVARVLSKMNPEVLQKVTREILKPVIEAIVRDEIDSKKS